MRLLNAETLVITDYQGLIPPYAILSHAWTDEEVSYAEFSIAHESPALKRRRGYRKVRECCRRALEDGLRYVWIDTCCIDKSSSSELSEAINSMFKWYRNSTLCYAYLEDIQHDQDRESLVQSLGQSRWFTRGWTLQELLAPAIVVFMANDWKPIGARDDPDIMLCISDITRIHPDFFKYGNLSQFSVAQRMSWAARRATTRIEDQAYCLLGLFSVNMPLLYGEGTQAFLRLQEEIMRTSDDQSLFAWAPFTPDDAVDSETRKVHDLHLNGGFLAPSPANFDGSGAVVRSDSGRAGEPYAITNRGLSIFLRIFQGQGYSLPLLTSRKSKHAGGVCLSIQPAGDFVILDCESQKERWSQIAIIVELNPATQTYMRSKHTSLGLISVPKDIVNAKATRRQLLIKANNRPSGENLSESRKQGKVVLIDPLPPALAGFRLVHTIPDFHTEQQDGAVSLRLYKSSSSAFSAAEESDAGSMDMGFIFRHHPDTGLLIQQQQKQKQLSWGFLLRVRPWRPQPGQGAVRFSCELYLNLSERQARKLLDHRFSLEGDRVLEELKGECPSWQETPRGRVRLRVEWREAPYALLIQVAEAGEGRARARARARLGWSSWSVDGGERLCGG